MNEILSRIEQELKKSNKKQTDLCSYVGISNSTFSTWKKRGTSPAAECIPNIAEFLGVSERYLLTGKEPERKLELTDKDERDIARRLEETLSELEAGQDGLMFSGEPLDDETRELLKISLENSIRLAKVTAKEKFTPKKYKK